MLPHNTQGCAGKMCLIFERIVKKLLRKIDNLCVLKDDAALP